MYTAKVLKQDQMVLYKPHG